MQPHGAPTWPPPVPLLISAPFGSRRPLPFCRPPVMRQPASVTMCVWTHAPASQPAVVLPLLSVSRHGVLFVTLLWVATHIPRSAFAGSISQPATLHSTGLAAVQGVLAVTGRHLPLVASHVPVLH